jgi:hypothetical protein
MAPSSRFASWVKPEPATVSPRDGRFTTTSRAGGPDRVGAASARGC